MIEIHQHTCITLTILIHLTYNVLVIPYILLIPYETIYNYITLHVFREEIMIKCLSLR